MKLKFVSYVGQERKIRVILINGLKKKVAICAHLARSQERMLEVSNLKRKGKEKYTIEFISHCRLISQKEKTRQEKCCARSSYTS